MVLSEAEGRLDMAQVHEVGTRFYWHTMSDAIVQSVKNKAVHMADTFEIEPPFRKGRSIVFRVPVVKKRIVFGRWVQSLRESEALLSAMGGRILQTNNVSLEEIDEF